MFLRDQNFKEIIGLIVAEGKEKFLDSLCASNVSRGKNLAPCPVCHKIKKGKGNVWMITQNKNMPITKDTFDSEDCAERAILWLRHIYMAYKNYLGIERSARLTEDDLRDPLLPKDNESPKKFKQRCIAHIELLAEFVPETNPDTERIEDHQ